MKQDINKKGNQQSKLVVGKMNQERVQIISISNGKTTGKFQNTWRLSNIL